MVRNTSHLSVFVPEHLREALELSARLHERSLSGEVRRALWSYVSPAGQLSYPHLPEGTRDEPGRRAATAGPTAPKQRS
jgi:hypothetical protein